MRCFTEVPEIVVVDAGVMDRHSNPASAHRALSHAATRIVVVGGGIAGAEASLTMAIGLPHSEVTLIGQSPSIQVLPDLVYMPFGVSSRHIDVPVEQLLPHGVRSLLAQVERVDVRRRVVHTNVGEVEFDVLVAAPGATSKEQTGRSLRTLDDALRIRSQLRQLFTSARAGGRGTITLCAESEDSWTAPACEMALLIGAWVRATGLGDRIQTILATADRDVFEWFGPLGEVAVESALRRCRVQVATGVPAGRFGELGGDLVIEFGALEARAIDGLPGRQPSGWYESSASFEVARNVFVIGDAVNLPYRAGFATAWQARRVLRALGGDLTRLGLVVDGIPSDAVEYQMDLADGVIRARVACADTLAHPFLGHDADIDVVPGARPDKLAGLLLHERVLLPRDDGTHDAPLAFRDALRDRQVACSGRSA